jgi:hypothetical protein
VRDTATTQIFMLTAPVERIGGQIFNVGSAREQLPAGTFGLKS